MPWYRSLKQGLCSPWVKGSNPYCLWVAGHACSSDLIRFCSEMTGLWLMMSGSDSHRTKDLLDLS